MAKQHSDRVRAQVIAALLAGQGVTKVAEETGVPHQTVSRWAKVAAEVAGREVGSKKATEQIGPLIAEYLLEALETLRDQARQFRDTDWLRKQDASSAAVLHGVLVDKVVRILDAAERGQREQDMAAASGAADEGAGE